MAGEERWLPLTQPALKGAQTTDFGKARGVIFKTQHAFQIEQLKLALIQLWQIVLGNRTVITDHPPRQRPRLGVAHTAQVLHHLLQGAVVGAHPRATIALTPARGLVAHDGQQFLLGGQRQSKMRGITLHLGRQLKGMGDQHQGRFVRAFSQGDFLE